MGPRGTLTLCWRSSLVPILFFDTRHPGEPVLTVMPYSRALRWGLWLNPKGASFVLLYKQTRWGFVGMVRGRGCLVAEPPD